MKDLIGTMKFPLAGKRNERREFPAGGPKVTDDGLAALVRQLHRERPFGFGSCYSNTERVCQNSWTNGWIKKIKPYAGWVVFDRKPEHPIHHAWAVLNDQLVIDMGQLMASGRLEDEYMAHWDEARKSWKGSAFDLNVAWREDWCRRLLPYEDGDVIENRVWGEIPPGMTYIGCPCLWEDARLTFNNWHHKNRKTVEYPRPGEQSPTQTIAELVRAGKTSAEILEICKRDYE